MNCREIDVLTLETLGLQGAVDIVTRNDETTVSIEKLQTYMVIKYKG